ncbi:MAG: DUF2855 family protein [Pseudomonadota bacterium]
MGPVKSVWVDRGDIRKTLVAERPSRPLQDGEVRVGVDKYGLTSNNVSYAISGDMIGYWKYYPAEGDWGQVPVWGMADVIESKSSEIAKGERLWGFFPMANQAILTVGSVRPDSFMEASTHRKDLPSLYNQYRRTVGEPKFIGDLEDERCLYVPLFGTSYILYDYLIDNEFFGAEQVLIGSVSSKTGFGLAQLIKQDETAKVDVVGLTSPGNAAFVRDLNCCDRVVAYGDEERISTGKKSAYVDMSGNSALTKTIHMHLGENVVTSCMVGGTHWDARAPVGDLPGATPAFFFTPAQISKRNQDWGPGVIAQKANQASFELAKIVSGQVAIERIEGPEAAAQLWTDMLDNKVSPSRGIMVSIR